MARRPPRQRSAPGIGWSGIGGILLLLLAIVAGGAFAYFYFSTPTRPTLDAQTLCPLTGPQGITVVLVDTSDDLPETTRREVLGMLEDMIASLPPFFKLDIRVLDIAGVRSRSLFSKCNPGDGAGLSEWTDNPRIARMRWIDGFRKPAADAVKNSIASAKANSSPIMAAIQDIAIDQFTSAAAQNAKKTLFVISDMIEYTKDYSQYPRAGDLSFLRYKQSPAYLKFRTDLHDATVNILYVNRQPKGPPVIDGRAHMQFWQDWIVDNKGKFGSAKWLQGA
ncbi:hypothetical protein SAMN05443248_4288 [Bradyrhizobium erythrophlei]|uniref:Uncharacterized protein n=1 Tax=Bradyrhizobium erythrophlei TaxID=1437360 RepID=A0A1M5RMG7_9BRAD|nr:hypothetical protein SAMN05443248_4288 [Bradyrhizobium erythrophlei]